MPSWPPLTHPNKCHKKRLVSSCKGRRNRNLSCGSQHGMQRVKQTRLICCPMHSLIEVSLELPVTSQPCFHCGCLTLWPTSCRLFKSRLQSSVVPGVGPQNPRQLYVVEPETLGAAGASMMTHTMVPETCASNTPQYDIGNYLGLYIRMCLLGPGGHVDALAAWTWPCSSCVLRQWWLWYCYVNGQCCLKSVLKNIFAQCWR